MPYALPDNPVPDDYIKLCVTIPNRREYIRAFLASYSGLARWTNWEREPTKSGAIAARHFLIAYNETVDNWTACESGEEEMATTIVNNYVTCGGCGSAAPTTLVCYGTDGVPVITPQPPIDPNPPPPVGDTWPITPLGDPPPGYESWTAYDGAMCIVANYMWVAARTIIATLENLGDLVTALAAILVAVIAILPAGMVAAFGGATLLEIIQAFASIIGYQEMSNILLQLVAWLDERKEEIVCTIYRGRYNLPAAMQQVISSGVEYVAANVTLSDLEKSGVYEFVYEVFPTSLPYRWMMDLIDLPAAGEPLDCSLCAGTFTWDVATDVTGTLAIEYQADDAVFASGLLGRPGEVPPYTYIKGGVGVLEGMETAVPSDCRAVSFMCHELSTNDPAGFLSINGMSVGMWGNGVGGQVPNAGIINETVLIKLANYAGPVTYDHVLTATIGDGLALVPMGTNENQAAFLFEKAAYQVVQYAVTIRVSNIRFLDIDGNVLAVQPAV